MVSLSLGSGPVVQNEILKMLEALSGIEAEVRELDGEENESEEIKKKKSLNDILSEIKGEFL